MSSRLTVAERSDITQHIKEILQRPRSFPHPMSDADQVKLWESFLPASFVASFHVLKDAGYQVDDMEQRLRSVAVVFNARDKLKLTLCTPAGFLWRTSDPDLVSIEPMRLEQVLGPKVTHDLIHWMRDIIKHEAAGCGACATLDQILKLPNTLGQLARMVPEIVPFLSNKAQATIATQEKSSQLPYEWAAFNKDQVHAAMDHISMCALMPKIAFRAGWQGNVLGFVHSEVRVERIA